MFQDQRHSQFEWSRFGPKERLSTQELELYIVHEILRASRLRQGASLGAEYYNVDPPYPDAAVAILSLNSGYKGFLGRSTVHWTVYFRLRRWPKRKLCSQ